MTHQSNPQHLPPRKSAAEYEAILGEYRSLLSSIEWSGIESRRCPACGAQGPSVPYLDRAGPPEHYRDCRLKRLLGE